MSKINPSFRGLPRRFYVQSKHVQTTLWILMITLVIGITTASRTLQATDNVKKDFEGSEPGVGWSNSPFLQDEPPKNKSWSDILEKKGDSKKIPPPPIDEVYVIKKGDTLRGALSKYGISKKEIARAIKALTIAFKPRHLKPGHRLAMQILPSSLNNKHPSLISLDFRVDAKTDIALVRNNEGKFVAQRHNRVLGRRIVFSAGIITSSLYETGQREGIPKAALLNLIKILSFDVDFQRDIRKNDRFAILFERLTDETGTTAEIGPIIFTQLKLKHRDIKLYMFKLSSNEIDYFDANGRSVKKLLLSTPTDAARISSGFGPRRHPILGYTKLHKGVDFAAPAGTPVYAAGDGVIEVAAPNGSYGNYIRIRHSNRYKTAYAHLKAFARGIRSGVIVRQRRVIGYIGSTGRSTGPHLHYEVIHNSKHVNPRGVRVPTGAILKASELQRFKGERERIDKIVAIQRTSKNLHLDEEN